MSDNNVNLTKQYLQRYHEHVKRLAIEQKYKELGIYELDADGNVVYEDEAKTQPKLKDATIEEAINDKLSKNDNLKWDASDFSYN